MEAMKWLSHIFGGHKMAALNTGTLAPDFTLPAMDGKQFSLKDALAQGPVLAAFFKISCPVCQFTFPFLERIYRAYGHNVTIIGISQNDKKETADFLKHFGITFPTLLDDISSYPVSNAYGLTNVPSLFWIAQDGEIEISSVGWNRKEIEQINRQAAETACQALKPVFQAGEDIPDFRAG
jgi:peroxiredoxin